MEINKISQIIIISILIEAIWENCKMIWQNGKLSIDMLGSLVMSIGVCMCAKADLFNAVGISMANVYVGSFFTGIIASRGANCVHDLFKRIRGE